MGRDSISIEFVEGHNSPRRGLAWLKNRENSVIDAKKIFDGLSANHQMYLRTSFDTWLSGEPDINSRYHGWKEPKYTACQVFKWRENRVRHRLYGFKTHPGIPDRRFEMCVLAMHTTKNTAEADPWFKKAMNKLRDDEEIQKVILRQLKELLDANTSANLIGK